MPQCPSLVARLYSIIVFDGHYDTAKAVYENFAGFYLTITSVNNTLLLFCCEYLVNCYSDIVN